MTEEREMPAKAWNGGSIEAAMESAREMRDRAIAQGASLCDECSGKGGTLHSLCHQCRGAGCIVPPEGLKLEGCGG